MAHSALSVTIVASLLAFGCVQEEEAKAPSGDPSTIQTKAAFHELQLEWRVQKADGSPDECPTTYPKLKVHANAVSESGTRNGDAFVQVFDCAAGKGSIRLQTAGDEDVKANADGSYPRSGARAITGKYSATMVITEASGETNYQAFPSQSIDLSKSDGKLSFVITPNAASRLTVWGLHAKSTSNSMSCAAAGVDTVRVKSKRVMLPDDSPDPAGKELVEEFPCEHELERVDCMGCSGAGTSKALAFGRYATSIEALSNGKVVGTLPYADDGFAIVDRMTVRLVAGAGNADWASVYMSDNFFVDITTR